MLQSWDVVTLPTLFLIDQFSLFDLQVVTPVKMSFEM
jgi:hypothetical protein